MIKFISKVKELIPNSSYDYSTLEELIIWLNGKTWFCADSETSGFQNFDNRVIMLQIGNDNDQFVIDTRNVDISSLKPFFESKDILKIFHNAKFDVNMLRYSFGFRTENVYDTLLAECVLTTGVKDRRLGLDYVVSKYCGEMLISKEERGSFSKIGSLPFTTAQIVYGAGDLQYLPCIKAKQEEEIGRLELGNVLTLENQTVLALSDIEFNGMVLDSEEWLVLANKAEKTVGTYEAELDDFVLDIPALRGFKMQYLQQDLFGGTGRKVSVNWDSHVQVKAVFRALGLDIESTSEKDIVKFQNTYPLVKRFIDYKKQCKLVSTYGREFLGNINSKTGRVHSSLWQVLETARMSSNNPNLQNIPAKAEYLACFKAPKGYSLVVGDYSGQEARVVTEGSQDELWMKVFNEGRDLHSEVAVMLFNIDISVSREKLEFVHVGNTKVYLRGKSPRDVAKTTNFGLLFGMTEYKLSDSLGITKDEAKAIIQKYYIVVPGISSFLKQCAAYAVRNRYIRSFKPYSILRRLDHLNPKDEKERGEMERAGRNTPIQASSAMMIKLALCAVREKILTLDYKVEIAMTIHDSIMTYVEEEYAEEWAEILENIMKSAGRIFIKSIPVEVDVKISSFWEK